MVGVVVNIGARNAYLLTRDSGIGASQPPERLDPARFALFAHGYLTGVQVGTWIGVLEAAHATTGRLVFEGATIFFP
jgi:hypothetical protein